MARSGWLSSIPVPVVARRIRHRTSEVLGAEFALSVKPPWKHQHQVRCSICQRPNLNDMAISLLAQAFVPARYL
ncbi:hypothetical protein U9M48_009816 [Paspalum notatum var. saurae]|uniref:Uncharacterized protein n=1 Tax=Paspalum notatum var. saurae TaxID=547442 RepID=A0AAQ3WFG2_PASNO